MKNRQLEKPEDNKDISSRRLSPWLKVGINLISNIVNFGRSIDESNSSTSAVEKVDEANEFTEKEKAILNVHIEEYKQLTAEIKLRIDFQQKLTNYQLLAAGIVGTIGINITQLDASQISKSESTRFYLLISPFVFLAFSWMFSNNDINIINLAEYISKKLVPNIRRNLDNEEVLNFESYIQEKRNNLVKHYGILAMIGQEFTISSVLPVPFVIIYSYLFYNDIYSLNNIVRITQALLLTSTFILYIKTVKLKWKIWLEYKHLNKTDNKTTI